jgi:hypothetical protein
MPKSKAMNAEFPWKNYESLKGKLCSLRNGVINKHPIDVKGSDRTTEFKGKQCFFLQTHEKTLKLSV